MIEVTAAALATHPFLRGVSPEELAWLSGTARNVRFPARHRLFEDGGSANRFWLIRSGHVSLDLHIPGQGPVVIESIGMGELLGWSWLFPPYRWAFGAVAAAPVEAFEFDAAAVREICTADPGLTYELTQRITQVLAKRLQATRIRLIARSGLPDDRVVRVLIAGAGVIGTVYGAHLGAAGHDVSVLRYPPRTDEVAARGLAARDVLDGSRVETGVKVVPDATAERYDLVLVTVRADQLVPAGARLTGLVDVPTVLFFGNNPGGRSAIPSVIPGEVRLGFPGVGGVIRGGVAEYVRIRQQPTALQAGSDPRLAEIEEALRQRGFRLQRVTDMDGWLAYHAAFVACVCAALYRCGTDATRLAADRSTLNLMCAAVTEAFTALRKSGTTGLPRNLAVLHNPALRPVAVRYWAKTMRSQAGELCFAAHARHAQAEMRGLGDQVTARLASTPATSHLYQLLEGPPARTGPTRSVVPSGD